MRKLGALMGMLVLGSLSVQAHAATVATDVAGLHGRAEHTCLSVFPLFFPQDCTASGSADLGLAFADTQQGPLNSGAFYAAGTAPDPTSGCTIDDNGTPGDLTDDRWKDCGSAEIGDNKTNLPITGTVTVDDSGTPGVATDDTVSFVLTIGAGQRFTSTSGGGMLESWTSIVHTLTAYAADSATANGDGGFDYVIGSAGMMHDIVTQDIDPTDDVPDVGVIPGSGGGFGNSEHGSNLSGCPPGNILPACVGEPDDVNVWSRPTVAGAWDQGGLPSNVNFGGGGVNNNVGGITVAVVSNDYTCVNTPPSPAVTVPPTIPDPDCAAIDGVGEDGFAIAFSNEGADWDNLIMTISTDGNGEVVSAKGYYVYMYDIILGGVNSWVGGSFSLTKANAVPVAVDDPINAVLVNSTISIDVLANDTDLDDVPLVVNIVTPPTVGTAVVNATGTTPADIRIDYTLAASGGNLTDSFTYEIVDGTLPPDTSNAATVDIQITNLTPIAINDTVATDQDVDAVIDVLANDALLGSLGDEPAVVTVPGAVTNGAIASITNNIITFTPTAAFTGVGSFDYLVTDFDGSIDTATVTVNIVNLTIPSASDDTAGVDVNAAVAINILANDAGLNDTPLTLTLEPTNSAANGTLTQADCGAKGTCLVTYTSNGTPGQDSFDYEIADATGGDPQATATVTIVVNDLPVAVDDTTDVNAGNALSISVLANDSGLFDEPLIVSFPTLPSIGAVSQAGCAAAATCVVTYTPNAGSSGADSFTYIVTDSTGDASTAATVTINDLPVAVADAATADSGGFVNIAVLANDGGISDEPLTVIVTAPANGSAIVNGSPGPAANISVTYTNSGAPGIDTFSYTVSDADGDSDNSSVAIAVSDPNIPLPVDDAAETSQNTAVTINILANDAGLDDTPITVTAESAPGNGTVTINGSPGNPVNINVTYTPDTDFTGTDSFVYRVTDSNGDTETATVTITVTMDEIVITIPGGSSSLGPWGLALLLIIAVPILRRRWSDSIR